MNSFTLSLPLLALIAIFSGAMFRNPADEMASAAPEEFARLYTQSKLRYKSQLRARESSPAASHLMARSQRSQLLPASFSR